MQKNLTVTYLITIKLKGGRLMQFLNNFVSDHLSKDAKLALSQAICTRGPRKGLLKKTAPKMGTPGYIGWQAIMLELCPARASVGGMMFMDLEERKVFNECMAFCEKFHTLINRDLQRPLEFNLWHMREDD
jgi:hypothetical protein